ncbi:hypothetical protein M5D96_005044 [Drosophila gunungcola]|uniref:Uncharacterized protein n=1 Tax=Drosophila gunungcola TaxID=103775 RepID=A0A9P9YV78_9MUSC|nr:hypothetical protein M5D96_005044 [Drosophila gunungcola]
MFSARPSPIRHPSPLPAPPGECLDPAPLPIFGHLLDLQPVLLFRDRWIMWESVLFVLRQFYSFVCPMQIFYEIDETEQLGNREEWDIWSEF